MDHTFEEFQEFRKILCVCPCCGELMRVSDLRLKAKGPSTETWLDKFEGKQSKFFKKEEKFREEEGDLRKKAQEKGRIAAEKVFNKAISPCFKKLGYDPYDIKPVLNPIDFIVFDKLNKEETVENVIMLSKKCKNTSLNATRKQVKTAITKKKYEWQVARVDDQGNIKFE